MNHESAASVPDGFEPIEPAADQPHEVFRELEGTTPYAPSGIANISMNPFYNPQSPRYDAARVERVRQYHQSLSRLFTDLAPAEVPDEIKDMMYLDFLAGNAQRGHKSLDGYGCLLAHRQEIGETAYAPYEEQFLLGEATPSQLLTFVKESGIHSCDITFVTHPYGNRMEHVYTAREAVSQAIREHHGTEFANLPHHYKKLSIQPQINMTAMDEGYLQLDGYLAVYKRLVGRFQNDDDTSYRIMERQAVAFNLRDASADMDASVYRDLHPSLPFQTNGQYQRWRDMVQRHAEGYFTDVIRGSIDIPDFATPTSTAMYVARETETTPRREEHERPRVVGQAAIDAALADEPPRTTE